MAEYFLEDKKPSLEAGLKQVFLVGSEDHIVLQVIAQLNNTSKKYISEKRARQQVG